jgi:hypothetical protein
VGTAEHRVLLLWGIGASVGCIPKETSSFNRFGVQFNTVGIYLWKGGSLHELGFQPRAEQVRCHWVYCWWCIARSCKAKYEGLDVQEEHSSASDVARG